MQKMAQESGGCYSGDKLMFNDNIIETWSR